MEEIIKLKRKLMRIAIIVLSIGMALFVVPLIILLAWQHAPEAEHLISGIVSGLGGGLLIGAAIIAWSLQGKRVKKEGK
jgi:hypothetical protein